MDGNRFQIVEINSWRMRTTPVSWDDYSHVVRDTKETTPKLWNPIARTLVSYNLIAAPLPPKYNVKHDIIRLISVRKVVFYLEEVQRAAV